MITSGSDDGKKAIGLESNTNKDDERKRKAMEKEPSTPTKKKQKQQDWQEDLETVFGVVPSSSAVRIPSDLPSQWKHKKFSEELKRELSSMKINLTDEPIPFTTDTKVFANKAQSKLEACVTKNFDDASVTDLLSHIYQGMSKSDSQDSSPDRLLLARTLLAQVAKPKLFRAHSVKNPSELELTGTCFSSLLNICGLFPSCNTNG